MRARSGFALLTVLWTIAAFGAVLETVAVVQTNAIRSAENRIDWQRAYWRAHACVQRARSAADVALDTGDLSRQTATWQQLDGFVARAPIFEGCSVTLEAAGTRIDLNGASREVLERGFAALAHSWEFEQVAERVLATRDAAPFVDARELTTLGPVELSDSAIAEIDRLFSVERGRVSLATASEAVLATVPGFTAEAARMLVEHRRDAGPIRDLSDLLPLLSHSAQAALIERYPDARRATTTEPDAWIVTSVAVAGQRAVPAELRCRWMRGSSGVEVVGGRIVR